MSTETQVSVIAVGVLAALHLFAPRWRADALEHPIGLSIAGGVSVAYVLVHLLPELAQEQREWLVAWTHPRFHWLDRQVYLAALIGLLIGLGIDYLTEERRAPGPRFWLNLTLAGAYNVIIGAVAFRGHTSMALVFAVVAFGAHSLVSDHSLHVRYGDAFVRYGRWVLAGALLLGWALTVAIEPHLVVIAALLGLLSGGMILSALGEELPAKHEGRFSYFVIGATSYAVLLLALEYLEASE